MGNITNITYESGDHARRAFIRRISLRQWEVTYIRLNSKTGAENYDRLHTTHPSMSHAQRAAKTYTA